MQGPQRTRAPARPVTPASPTVPVDAARQERFLRQLAPSPWDEVAESEAIGLAWFDTPIEAADEGGDEGSSPHDDDGRNEGEDSPEPAPAPAPEPEVAGPAQPFTAWPWMRAGGLEPGPSRGDDSSAEAVSTASSASRDPAWLGDIVQQITQWTEGGDARFQHWSITVPLDPQALPDCELRLTLSPGTMALRFRTGSAESAALVSRHRDTLRARLEALPSSPTAIDIDLE
jgi:hypothetical protein